MKLVLGQATTPVPWPIQSRPTTSRSRPTIKSNLRNRGLPLSAPAPWRLPIEADLTFATLLPRVQCIANVKSKAPLASIIASGPSTLKFAKLPAENGCEWLVSDRYWPGAALIAAWQASVRMAGAGARPKQKAPDHAGAFSLLRKEEISISRRPDRSN